MSTLTHIFIIVWNRQSILLEMKTLLLTFGKSFCLLGIQECSCPGAWRDGLYLWAYAYTILRTQPTHSAIIMAPKLLKKFPYSILLYCLFPHNWAVTPYASKLQSLGKKLHFVVAGVLAKLLEAFQSEIRIRVETLCLYEYKVKSKYMFLYYMI